MFSSLFINRPVLSSVLSILLFLVGVTSLVILPIEQFPNLLPPQITVQTSYPGSSAQTVSNVIAAPLEEQVNGVENIMYMYSNSSSTGAYVLNVLFNIGSDIRQGLIDVQNKVNLSLPQLPDEVQRGGVSVLKRTPSILLVIALQSPDGRYDNTFLSNYGSLHIVDELQRLPGVSNVSIINDRSYAMRIWLNPLLLIKYGLTITDVAEAIRDQNSDYAIGRLGEEPMDAHAELTLSITSEGRLETPEAFNTIILKSNEDGSNVLLRDVGYAELGSESYDVISNLNNVPALSIAVFQQFGANALSVATEVEQKMESIAKSFPQGISYSIPFNTTHFVYASIREVAKTILEAAFLVTLVVYFFLQNLRLTLIPLQAMCISMIGACAGMLILGLSINTLTLFAMVLAIGIVVDDAIVVIENIESKMRTGHLSPKEAAHAAMREVSGPVIAIVLVLCSVFIPVAFLGGIAGQLYKQFALTICLSVVLSGFVALTLSPAMSALLISSREETKPPRFARWFNLGLEKLTNAYEKGVRFLIVRPFFALVLFLSMCGALGYFFHTIPMAFVPNEDQGYLINVVSMPEGTSLKRTVEVTEQAEKIALKNPALDYFFSLTGYSFIDGLNRTTQGSNFLILKDWKERTKPSEEAPQVLNSLTKEFSQIPEGALLLFNPPAIHGLGTIGGFEFWIQNRSSSIAALEKSTAAFLQEARKRPELTGLFSTLNSNAQQVYIDLDRAKARILGVPILSIYQTLQGLFGSYYVNNFNKFGRVYRVIVMAESRFRESPEDISQIYVRSRSGTMVPLSSLVHITNRSGPSFISRFNGFAAAKITGAAAKGYSSGEALDAMEDVAKKVLSSDMTYAWGGESYQERTTQGSSTKMLFAGMLMVFLILAALYERWSLPLAILLAVPFGIFGALLAIWLTGMTNDIYFQIGLITIIALSAKNAILIVEFAMIQHQEHGLSYLEAAIAAGRLRLRAILMTSLTFIFGVVPLVFSSGAGANSRHSVGTGVLGGMLAATFLAIFFVPLFFRLLAEWTDRTPSNSPMPPVTADLKPEVGNA